MSELMQHLFRNGRLCSLQVGLSEEQIVSAFGLPEATGGTSRKQKTPTIYKYGDVEVFLTSFAPKVCVAFYIERQPEQKPLRFITQCPIDDVEQLFRMSKEMLEIFLVSEHINWLQHNDTVPSYFEIGIRSSKMLITFDEEDKIASVSVHRVDNL